MYGASGKEGRRSASLVSPVVGFHPSSRGYTSGVRLAAALARLASSARFSDVRPWSPLRGRSISHGF
jgi:hypothetical protein